MKITAVILLAACLSAAATGKAQKVSLTLRDAPLEKALKEIKRQTGLDLLYTVDVLQHARPVTIELRNADLRQALDQCFKEQPLTYTIVENVIVVKLRPVTSAEGVGEEIVAAPIDVKGRVVNEAGEPVVGATVQVKGDKSKGTITDENGYFELRGVEENSTLLISSVNIEPYEIKVGGRADLATLKVRTRIVQGEDVVINTGYQRLKPNEATGSVVVITKEQLDQRVAPDILSKLEGIVNGLVFNRAPSGDSKIKIRGESTIYGNPNPLIVVNNFPYDGDINNLNPNDVESITILKDAAAASIWGVQAGNGVIVITTKNGKFNQPLKVSFNSNLTILEKPDLFYKPQINPSDYIDVEKFLFDQGHYDGIGIFFDPAMPAISPVVELLDQQRNGFITSQEAASQINAFRNYDLRNDLNKFIYRNAIRQQYSVNFSGGSPKASYYFSTGYDRDLPEIKGNYSDRITLNLQNRFTPIKNLEFNLSMFYTEGLTSSNASADIPNAFPYTRIKDENGNELSIPQHRAIFEDTIGQYGFFNWKYYPLKEPNNVDNRRRNTDIRANLGIKYTILPGLAVEGSYQYTRSLTREKKSTSKNSFELRNLLNTYAIVSDGYYIGTNFPDGGKLNLATNDLVGHYGRLAMTYNKNWSRHSLNTIAGMNVQEISTEGSTQTFYGYNDENGSFATPLDFVTYYQLYPSGYFASLDPPHNTYSGGVLNRFRSYFGNAAYTYYDRYTFSASARIDGSNYFGVKTKEKVVPLWSAGFKWDINKESYYRSRWIPQLNLRLSYGYNGNLDLNTTAVTTVLFGNTASFTGLPYGVINNIPNPQLRWERTAHFNVGLGFGLINNRISGSIEYYRKKGTDLIGDAPIDPTTGVGQIRGNFSAMKSSGMDFMITSKIINRGLQWQSSFIVNCNAEKITRYDLSIPASLYSSAYSQILPRVGKPLFSLYSYRFGGLEPTTGNPQGYVDGSLSTDYSSITTTDDFNDLVYSGRYNPPIFGSMFNQLTWNGISLSFNITYKLNYYFRRSSINYSQLFGDWKNGHSDYALRWQNTGDEKITNVPSMIYPADASRDIFFINSDVLIEKGDHIRLQYINLNYTLRQKAFGKLPFQSLQFYAYANNINLMLWSANKRGIDPDFPYSQRPSRSWSIGLQANF